MLVFGKETGTAATVAGSIEDVDAGESVDGGESDEAEVVDGGEGVLGDGGGGGGE